MVTTSQRKEMAQWVVKRMQVSIRVACAAFGVSESCYRYECRRSDENAKIADWLLRLPYAQARTQNELNKAYAHVSTQSWAHAVTQLHDRLVSMGFEAQEAEEYIYAQPSFVLEEKAAQPFEVGLVSKPDLSKLDIAEKACVKIEETPQGTFVMKVEGNFTKGLIEKLAKAATDKKDKAEIALKGKIHIKHQDENLTPSQRGEKFTVPQLCLNFEDGAELAERELFLGDNGWNLLDYPTTLDFTIDEQARQYQVDMAGQKITIKELDSQEQLSLAGIKTDLSENDLCRWLDKKLRQPDVKQEILLEFLRRIIRNLLARDDMDMPKLVRGKFILEKVLADKIATYRNDAYKKGYLSTGPCA